MSSFEVLPTGYSTATTLARVVAGHLDDPDGGEASARVGQRVEVVVLFDGLGAAIIERIDEVVNLGVGHTRMRRRVVRAVGLHEVRGLHRTMTDRFVVDIP